MSQIADKSVTIQIAQPDVDFLCTNGYVSIMQKEDYDQASTELAGLAHLTAELENERVEESSAEAALEKEERKTRSITFHFEAKEKREAELVVEESQEEKVSKEEADIAEKGSKINALIQKKSAVDRMVPYGGRYLALTALGVVTLNDLNVRNYRVSDSEFSDFVEESRDTSGELHSIAERGSSYVSNISAEFPRTDLSQLWSASIGLAKLQGDQNQIIQRFLLALGLLHQFRSTLENKMMAAEIMTSFRKNTSQPSADMDLQTLSATIVNLERQIRREDKVPKQLSAGVAAMIMAGRRYDGSYPTDRYTIFSKLTPSFESAAILSVINVPTDQLVAKFQAFRSLFASWGYRTSEDTELASAYLAISELGPDDVKTKMTIILDALKNYLEYPVVAASILTSIPTLEANEILYLMEKASSLLSTYAIGLQRSELVSLAVRMIHGIRNELVKELDPTAKIANTPVQFTHIPSVVFFPYSAPLIVAHSSYFATFSGIGGVHPAHVHGVGGFFG